VEHSGWSQQKNKVRLTVWLAMCRGPAGSQISSSFLWDPPIRPWAYQLPEPVIYLAPRHCDRAVVD
jgi:hypothetical protein